MRKFKDIFLPNASRLALNRTVIVVSQMLVAGAFFSYLLWAPNPNAQYRCTFGFQGAVYDAIVLPPYGELLAHGVVKYKYKYKNQQRYTYKEAKIYDGYFGIMIEAFDASDIESFAITGIWRAEEKGHHDKNLLRTMIASEKTSVTIPSEKLFMKRRDIGKKDPMQLIFWVGHPVRGYEQKERAAWTPQQV